MNKAPMNTTHCNNCGNPIEPGPNIGFCDWDCHDEYYKVGRYANKKDEDTGDDKQ